MKTIQISTQPKLAPVRSQLIGAMLLSLPLATALTAPAALAQAPTEKSDAPTSDSKAAAANKEANSDANSKEANAKETNAKGATSEKTLKTVTVTDTQNREAVGYNAGASAVGKTQQALRDIPNSVTVIPEQLIRERRLI
jgi:outer membrane receptor for ferric coprogen and ferric-rhodotorulic acid